MWSVWLTFGYLVLSLQANRYANETSIIDYKALAIIFSSTTMNLCFIVTLISWTVIHPWIWITSGWGTFQEVFNQFFIMSIHTLPTICASINFWLLTDATAYMSDFGLTLLMEILYLITSYYYYDKLGWTMYYNLNYSDPGSYWLIALSIIGMPALAFFSHTIISLGSQALMGRYEWESRWLWPD